MFKTYADIERERDALAAKLAEARRLLQSLAGCGLTDEHDREIDAFLADKGTAESESDA